MSDSTLREVVRTAVAAMSPSELLDFDQAAQAIAAAPNEARRALRGRHEPNAFGWAGAADLVLGYLLLLGAELTKDLAKDLAKDAVRSGSRTALRSLWRRLRRQRQIELDVELPALSVSELAAVRRHVEQGAVGEGASPELAAQLADALVTAWPRRA